MNLKEKAIDAVKGISTKISNAITPKVMRVAGYIVVIFGVMVMVFSCKGNDPVENQYDIELARLQAMYPGFRIDLKNAQTVDYDITTAWNDTFNENGGASARNADDSIKSALTTSQIFYDRNSKFANSEKNFVLNSTCKAAMEQKKIVDSLLGNKK